MKNVLDLDDYLNDDDEKKFKPKKKILPKSSLVNLDLIRNEEAGIGRLRVKEVKVKKLEDDESIVAANVALNRHANAKMNKYLKKAPQHKILEKQKELLKEELRIYGKAKNMEFVEKTRQLIRELEVEKQKFIKFFKKDNITKEAKLETEEKLKSSEKLKELKLKVKELKKEYADNNPNALLRQLKELKEAMDSKASFTDSGDLQDIDSIYDEDFDDEIDEDSDSIENQYLTISQKIANILDTSVADVIQMKFGPLLIELKKYCPDTTVIKDEISLTQMEASAEMKRLKGGNDITDIIFEIFDFSKDEEEPKELLAASNIRYVSAIAYRQCSSMNKMQYFDDCCSAGLLGLSLAINKWYDIQKINDSALSFEGFAYSYIVNAIKKELYYWSSNNGMISPSVLASIDTRRKKSIEMWLKINPDFKNVPKDMLEDMLEGVLEEKPAGAIGEGALSALIGGDESIESDVWANSGTAGKEDSFIDAKIQYEEILKGIGALFNLFETKTDKETGVKIITNRKIFDKYDLKLFMMTFEMEFKQEATKGGTHSDFTQKDIANVLMKMYAKDGRPDVTLGQSSISTRYKTIINKLALIMEDNPSIKLGFQYYIAWLEANRENVQLLSNFREEIGTKIERDKLSQFYKDNQKVKNIKLTDGSTLASKYQVLGDNAFDSDIADYVKMKF